MQSDEERAARRFRHPDAIGSRPGGGGSPPEAAVPSLRRAMPRPPRRGWRWLRKLVAWLIMLGVMVALAYAVYIVNIVAKISTNAWALSPLAADSSARTNILALGVGDPGHDGENLTDTMMLLSIDGNNQRLAQVSIPRDLRVNIPGFGLAKINAANADGGVDLAEQTVSNTLGVPINYYVKTNFSGLKDVVDAVGGLDVDVKDRLLDREYPCDDDQYKVCGLDIQPGMQHMDGRRALQYARCRKGTCGDDFGRAARQQELVKLLRPKVTDPALLLHPLRLKLLVSAVQKGVQTDLGLIQLLEVAKNWRAAAANQPVGLVLSTAPGGYLKSDPAGSSDLLPVGGDFSAIAEHVQSIFGAASVAPAP